MSMMVPSPMTAPMLMTAPIMVTVVADGDVVANDRAGSMRALTPLVSSRGTAELRPSFSTS